MSQAALQPGHTAQFLFKPYKSPADTQLAGLYLAPQFQPERLRSHHMGEIGRPFDIEIQFGDRKSRSPFEEWYIDSQNKADSRIGDRAVIGVIGSRTKSSGSKLLIAQLKHYVDRRREIRASVGLEYMATNRRDTVTDAGEIDAQGSDAAGRQLTRQIDCRSRAMRVAGLIADYHDDMSAVQVRLTENAEELIFGAEEHRRLDVTAGCYCIFEFSTGSVTETRIDIVGHGFADPSHDGINLGIRLVIGERGTKHRLQVVEVLAVHHNTGFSPSVFALTQRAGLSLGKNANLAGRSQRDFTQLDLID